MPTLQSDMATNQDRSWVQAPIKFWKIKTKPKRFGFKPSPLWIVVYKFNLKLTGFKWVIIIKLAIGPHDQFGSKSMIF